MARGLGRAPSLPSRPRCLGRPRNQVSRALGSDSRLAELRDTRACGPLGLGIFFRIPPLRDLAVGDGSSGGQAGTEGAKKSPPPRNPTLPGCEVHVGRSACGTRRVRAGAESLSADAVLSGGEARAWGSPFLFLGLVWGLKWHSV